MIDNAADRKSIRAKEKAARIAAARREAVIRNTMSTIEGRAWLWDLLSSCHIFASTFTPDPLTTAFAEGQRCVGLTLLADIMATCPDAYVQAQREANDRHLGNDNDTTHDDSPASDSFADEQRSGTESDWGDSGSVSVASSSAHHNHFGLIDDAVISEARRRGEAVRE